MEAQVQKLKDYLAHVTHLRSAQALLEWDQATYCPPAAHESRASQLSALSGLIQEKVTSPLLGQLLDQAEAAVAKLPKDDPARSVVEVTRLDYERERLIDPEFKSEMTGHFAHTYHVWTKAKKDQDWAALKPLLQKSLDLTRRYSEKMAHKPHVLGLKSVDHPMDPLISLSDFGQRATSIRALFDELRQFLVPFANRLLDVYNVDDSCLYGHFPLEEQKKLSQILAQGVGYQMDGGRIDVTHHPFATHIGPGDVRITTRYFDKYLGESISSTIHECGHAMYEQGIAKEWEGTPLNSGVSAGVHESQSRLWENIVGRSEEFWVHFYPELQKLFPQFRHLPLDVFVRAFNRVRRSLIRVDADEVTYNLHVMIRFDLECQLLEGKLSIAELPEAWNARYQSDLGLRPTSYSEGVMQDVHWYAGFLGGSFQGYTIGNIFSAQIFEAYSQEHPHVKQDIAQGRLSPLRVWLTDRLYRHGRRYTPDATIRLASGSDLSVEPYRRYLISKYEKLSQSRLTI